jgi:Icc-related predicted phosphoesterase
LSCSEYDAEKLRTELARDERVNELGIQVTISESRAFIRGKVPTAERRDAVEQVAREVLPECTVINEVTVAELEAPISKNPRTIRMAAVGDIHFGEDCLGCLAPQLGSIEEQADVLLIAGDLTKHGAPEEAAALANELKDVPIPVVAVLGNHDYHCDAETEIRSIVESAGVTVLEGESTTLTLGSRTLGIAGTKGFGGGFAGACGSDFGEPEMKAFIRHTKTVSKKLGAQLASLRSDYRVALLHYSPVEDTLVGERLEIYPFLGSFLLAEAIDSAGADFAIHGHAHRGSEKGVTAKGITVRNVAQPMLGRPYAVYSIGSPHEQRQAS